jgi:hypothetical protein
MNLKENLSMLLIGKRCCDYRRRLVNEGTEKQMQQNE